MRVPEHYTTASKAYWFPLDETDILSLEDDIEVDIAIVGGGYSGLSAAYHLKQHDPGLDIALFEAELIGQGASGLNSGQCAPRIGPSIEKQIRELGPDVTAQCYQYSLDAMVRTAVLIKQENIDCDLQQAAQLQVALTASQAETLSRHAKIYKELGFDVSLLKGEPLRSMLPSSPGVLAALKYPAFTLNPGKLCHGLKKAVLDLGARIFERSRITELEIASTIRLQCNRKLIKANRLIIATDGLTCMTGLFRKHIFPVKTFCATSRPLSPMELSRVQGEGVGGFYDSRHMFNFIRFTPDNRILIGGEYHYCDPSLPACQADHEKATANLQTELSRMFPALKGTQLEQTWSGILGCTLDGWPVISPLGASGNAWFVGAWNGHGVALATSSGQIVTECLLGSPQTLRPWMRTRIPGIPSASLARPAISTYLAFQRARDALDGFLYRFAQPAYH